MNSPTVKTSKIYNKEATAFSEVVCLHVFCSSSLNATLGGIFKIGYTVH